MFSKTAAKEMKGKCRVGLTDKMTVFPMLLEQHLIAVMLISGNSFRNMFAAEETTECQIHTLS